MLIPAKILVVLGVVWAIAALTRQVIAARAGGRTDYSAAAGSPWAGLWYNLTAAMSPRHKESARLHPAEFALGVVLHVGTLITLLGVLLLIIWPAGGATLFARLWPAGLLSLGCGVALLVRRAGSPMLRSLSTPDDYLAILATCGLLGLAAAYGVSARGEAALLVYAGLLLIYLPLGKLRHAVFFFVARANYGWRLGHRGVYPPAKMGVE